MPLKPDGDVIRGLGYVTLHAAYLEERLNDLLGMFDSVDSLRDQDLRSPISQRIRAALALVGTLTNDRAQELHKSLSTAEMLFRRRNDLVHGRIYDAPYGQEGKYLHQGRSGEQVRRIDANELYALANELRECELSIDRSLLSVAREISRKWTEAKRDGPS